MRERTRVLVLAASCFAASLAPLVLRSGSVEALPLITLTPAVGKARALTTPPAAPEAVASLVAPGLPPPRGWSAPPGLWGGGPSPAAPIPEAFGGATATGGPEPLEGSMPLLDELALAGAAGPRPATAPPSFGPSPEPTTAPVAEAANGAAKPAAASGPVADGRTRGISLSSAQRTFPAPPSAPGALDHHAPPGGAGGQPAPGPTPSGSGNAPARASGNGTAAGERGADDAPSRRPPPTASPAAPPARERLMPPRPEQKPPAPRTTRKMPAEAVRHEPSSRRDDRTVAAPVRASDGSPGSRQPAVARATARYTVPFADGSAAVSRLGAAIVEQAATAAGTVVILSGRQPIDRNRAEAVRMEFLTLGVRATIATADERLAAGEVRIDIR